MNTIKKIFSFSSTGFIYSVSVAALTIFAAAGAHFSSPIGDIAGNIDTTLSASGVWAMIGVIAASVIAPIWNAIVKGTLSFKGVFSSTLTWIAILNAGLAYLATKGFSLPDGTVEQIFGYIQAKDWFSLGYLLVATIVPTIIRFIKSKTA